MCGIAGFVGKHDLHTDAERTVVLDRMCRVIAHRGPDDQGMMVEGLAALGMRRLSIIDVAGGHQPISGCDGHVTVVFNGEIYNFQELQRDLESRGHRFQTHSDTEAIVHAFEEYGADCVKHLRGMFAFAIWDERERKLFLARDRVGKKPLFYSLTDRGTLVFGSELKSLLEHPHVRRELNPAALDAYLTFGYVPEDFCIFHDIHKLAPGHHLTFADGRVKTEMYWDFDYSREESRTEDEWVEELRALIDESVRLRLISDVPLGAFLSGGVDSSTIVGFMARNMNQPVKTFSIGFNEDTFSELKYARIAAKHFGTDHHEFIVTPDICNIVDDLVRSFDEPFADSSALPTYVVSKMAREYVTVALAGDGGDELFAGYTRYVIDKQRSGFANLPRAIREGVLRPLSRRLPHGALGRNFLYNISLDPIDRYVDSISIYSGLRKSELYTDSFRNQLKAERGATELFHDLALRSREFGTLNSLLYLDAKTYLPGDILTKVDRMSMAASLEVRAPLLDHKLIEFVTRIPSSLKMRETETKYILKQAVKEMVPAEILDRPKMGFGVPIQEWINDQLRTRIRETLGESRTRDRGIIEQNYIATMLDEHDRGRRDHSGQLWALLMLELWFRSYLDVRADPVGQQVEDLVALIA